MVLASSEKIFKHQPVLRSGMFPLSGSSREAESPHIGLDASAMRHRRG